MVMRQGVSLVALLLAVLWANIGSGDDPPTGAPHSPAALKRSATSQPDGGGDSADEDDEKPSRQDRPQSSRRLARDPRRGERKRESKDARSSQGSSGGKAYKRGDPLLFSNFPDLFRTDLAPDAGPSASIQQVLNSTTNRTPPSMRSISNPGPDLAGFPNSAFTLPAGRVYVEQDPLSYYSPSTFRNTRYNYEFLIRYGLTDAVEFRIFSNGFTWQRTHPMPGSGSPLSNGSGNGYSTTTGFSPLALDIKAHLWDENRVYGIPACALEVYIQTPWGSHAFDQGTQPSLNLNLDWSLTDNMTLEINTGITGNRNNQGALFYQYSFQWSLQQKVTDNFQVYTHGFLNNAALPRFGAFSTSSPQNAVVVGVGAMLNVSKRRAIFGSYNWGLDPGAHSHIALFGTAYAY